MITPIIPKTAKGKFILFSFSLYFLAAIIHYIYVSDIDILSLSRSQSLSEYLLRVIRDLALSCALVTLIIDGIRVVRREGVSLKRISIPILGAIICFLLVMVAWSAQYRVRELNNIMLSKDKRILERIEKTLPELINNPIENSRKIYLLAKMRYKLDGKQIKYPNEQGEFLLYQPSEEERNFRGRSITCDAGAKKKTKLFLYDLEKQKETELGEVNGYEISADGKKMLINQERTYAIIDLPSAKIDEKESLKLSDMSVMLDRKAEWMQMYNECWRQMRDFFFDPHMHGVDWPAVKTKYAALVPYVNHRADLTYISSAK